MSKTVLLVDDDRIFCNVLADALKSRGFVPSITYDIETALEVVLENRIQYAIVDLRIGLHSGLTLINKIVKKQGGIKIIVLTGYASIATAVEAIKLGAYQYLTKPADIQEIVEALDGRDRDQEIVLPDRPLSPKRLEWEHIQKVLIDNDGNVSASARALNMHRRTLQRKLNKRPVKE